MQRLLHALLFLVGALVFTISLLQFTPLNAMEPTQTPALLPYAPPFQHYIAPDGVLEIDAPTGVFVQRYDAPLHWYMYEMTDDNTYVHAGPPNVINFMIGDESAIYTALQIKNPTSNLVEQLDRIGQDFVQTDPNAHTASRVYPVQLPSANGFGITLDSVGSTPQASIEIQTVLLVPLNSGQILAINSNVQSIASAAVVGEVLSSLHINQTLALTPVASATPLPTSTPNV
jgi:hypothetical protein